MKSKDKYSEYRGKDSTVAHSCHSEIFFYLVITRQLTRYYELTIS